MILIADSGSTKTTWCLMDPDGQVRMFHTEGYNPYYVSDDYIVQSIKQGLPAELNASNVKNVYFYGAGCDDDRVAIMRTTLAQAFSNAEVSVYLDLLASARGLLGNAPGFVSILGTGCNTCLYDGENIIHHVDPLGFILGDEGSAAFLGRKLLQDYLRGTLPEKALSRFNSQYKINRDEVFYNVYTQPMPNRYCADFCKFLQLDCDYSRQLIRFGFRQFFENLVCLYPGYKAYSFNSVGTVGFVFRELLEEVAAEFGMKTNKVLTGPMEGLIDYHRTNRSLSAAVNVNT